jgi:hypothetical protein
MRQTARVKPWYKRMYDDHCAVSAVEGAGKTRRTGVNYCLEARLPATISIACRLRPTTDLRPTTSSQQQRTRHPKQLSTVFILMFLSVLPIPDVHILFCRHRPGPLRLDTTTAHADGILFLLYSGAT